MTDMTRTHDCPVCGDTLPLPADVIAALAETPERLAEALRAAGDREPEGWSPAFVAVHMADLEVSRGWRFRQILASDDPVLDALDQDSWAENLRYDDRSLEPQHGLTRPYHHTIFGAMTLAMLVDHTYDHDQAHLRQIVRLTRPM